MNDDLNIEGNTITFKSDVVYFNKERSGLKSNTARFVDVGSNLSNVVFIKMVHSESGAFFTRTKTDISSVGQVLGKELFIFSWG